MSEGQTFFTMCSLLETGMMQHLGSSICWKSSFFFFFHFMSVCLFRIRFAYSSMFCDNIVNNLMMFHKFAPVLWHVDWCRMSSD